MKTRNRKDGWTDADKQYLRDKFETLTNQQIATALNRSVISIQTMASKELGLKRSSGALSRRLVETWKNRDGTWLESEKQYLVDNWQAKTKEEMATALGRTPSAVKSMGQKEMGLKKTKESLRAIMKRKGNGGTFRKGNMPYNTIYGDEQVIRIRKNKNGPSYKWIRTGFKQWKQYHVWVWEATNGPVPDDQMVTFRNGDQMDCSIENLMLTTRAEHAIRHSASLNLTDGFVANTIAYRDKELKEEILKYPELIELQRTKIQLNRLIKHEQTT
ncbi:HNH endonuclease signature motif containing protein [Spirosoma spitsbergense]|uniref:HNH endonuclease signature motif containing protein n=1 Tax=Spirosoma spitsbergense TaxID=431554 RepID=UPI00038156DE|nr:HNH endonuclease signature motif containing protein [Spirosoma spitsbergense]